MGLEILVSRRRPAALAAFGLIGVLLGGGCQGKPQPDPDGTPPGARSLALDSWRTDQLFCKAGDCADWYRIDLPERGDLQIDVVAPEGVARNFALSLSTADTEILTRTGSGGTGRAQLFWATREGTYLIEVMTTDKGRRALGYDIQARFEPEPVVEVPLPPDLVRAEVIEIEGVGAPEAVLIGIGADHGLRAGQRGRLIYEGEELGRIEVQDVYQEGSRLRIDGPLSAPITHPTVAEIEVPGGSIPFDEDDPFGDPDAFDEDAPPSDEP